MNIGRLFSVGFLIVAFVGFLFFSRIVSLVADWWWYQEVGFTEVFLKSLSAKLVVGAIAGVVTFVFLLANLLIANYSKIHWMASIPKSLIGESVTINSRIVGRIGVIFVILISLFIGLATTSLWDDVLKFLSSVPFGSRDPIFDKDVSFYVFQLPLYSISIGLIKTLILVSLVVCTTIYLLRRSLSLSLFFPKFNLAKLAGIPENLVNKITRDQGSDQKARIHVGILIFLLFISIAAGAYLSLFELLTSQNGYVFGASFTDVNVTIPLTYISIAFHILAAVLALFYAISGRIAPLFGAIFVTVIVGLFGSVVPSIFQNIVVAPNELSKETPFIKHNIEASQKAYNLDTVEEREIAAERGLTAEDIANNEPTIKNVRLWDRDPLLSTFSQIQEIRTYYEFASVDNDRYIIDDEVRQIMLSPRELASDSLPNKNWINEKLTFTHGYGVAAGPVNQVTPEGLPVLFVKDLPPKSEVAELSVDRPEVYYGEIPNDYVIVKTKSKEFDYPKGEENVYSEYAGKGGVEVNSVLRRALYSLRFGSPKIFLSSDITNESRIMYNRNILQRVSKIVPFLTFDHDPYMVIADSKLYWILDAYTTTSRYPYSQQLQLDGGRVNYIRNSVKAVVDAYNGEISIYRADSSDPISNTYAKIFPNTFKDLKDMPDSLKAHVRYPEDIFSLQTAIYTIYHMDDPQIFYNKEDQWEIPSTTQGDDAKAMGPRHMIMTLPNEEKEEFILMLPFTPRAKDNLSAWMVARNDGDEYGKLIVYRFPKDKLVFGPKQIIGRISQDATISQQISLWDQTGSQVIQGPLLVIPIEESLVYVRPLYLKATTGKIPELKRVIVAYENKIAMEETLDRGLARIFGSSEGDVDIAEERTEIIETDLEEGNLGQRANDAYNAALRAQRDGDWARYGEEIKKLGDILNNLSQ